MDEYCMLVLMWRFNPVLTSLRGLQQASTLADVQKKFGVGRSSLGPKNQEDADYKSPNLQTLVERAIQTLRQ
jgi:hypothetical protein